MTDDVRTHWDGCWTVAGHEACQEARIAQRSEQLARLVRLWEAVEAATGLRFVDQSQVAALDAAVDVLDARPRDAAGARLAMHDVLCANGSDCGARVEHSRTSTETVRALRKALAAEALP